MRNNSITWTKKNFGYNVLSFYTKLKIFFLNIFFRIERVTFERIVKDIKKLFPSMEKELIFRSVNISNKNTVGLGGPIYSHYKLIRKRLFSASILTRARDDNSDDSDSQEDPDNVPSSYNILQIYTFFYFLT